jgi:hypothetical protein
LIEDLLNRQDVREDRSGITPKEWSLLPTIEGEAIAWFVPELGETHSSMDLADAIAKELSEVD